LIIASIGTPEDKGDQGLLKNKCNGVDRYSSPPNLLKVKTLSDKQINEIVNAFLITG
jgi:hypothetical protein